MAQHFLLSAAARSLSLSEIARMSDEQARDTLKKIRWADNSGEPYCPRCGCLKVKALATRPVWNCSACRHQFSVTSGTIFADRKLSVRDYLLAVAIFANGAKGHSALQLSRDLNCQYRTAYVLAHKLRESLAPEQQVASLTGTCEIDGAYFGAAPRKENYAEDRADRRTAEHKNTKRQVVVVLRERKGRTLSFVCKKEGDAVPAIRSIVPFGATIHADENRQWDVLHAHYDMRRVNHSVAYSIDGACTNQAESFFSRLRRAEIGIHHRVSGKYLGAYATEMTWREDNRRMSNGKQFQSIASAAINHPMSRVWRGYWDKRAA